MAQRTWLTDLLKPRALMRLALAIAASIGLWLLVSAWIGDRTQIEVQFAGKPVSLLSPQWLHLVAVEIGRAHV